MESKRITGTEMEWAAMVPGPEDYLIQLTNQVMSPYVACYIKSQNMAWSGNPTHYYLANGSRFYSDVGEHREYATPEDNSFEGTLTNEIAGEQIMAGVMRLYQESTGQSVTLVKRVVDDHNIGSGYHISYSADAEQMSITEDDLALFGVFAATRSVLFGAGALLSDGSFILGQKANTVNCDFATGTTQVKPVVNLRNEPHADKERFLRVHDTSSDPNMSPWSTRVKLAAGSMVIKLIEQQTFLEELRFTDNLAYVTKEVTKDNSLSARFKMVEGNSMTALDVQLALIAAARQLENCNGEELWALDEWEKAARDLQQNPRLVGNRVEWFIRKQILEQQHERHGWGWNSQGLRAKDRQFSEFMGNGIGLALRESDKAWAPYMPKQSQIDDRIQNPPCNTRARMRGQYINFRQQFDNRSEELSWNYIKFQGETFRLNDPFAPRHAGLETAMKHAGFLKQFSEQISA